jgi:hypothetical protein
LEAYVNPTLATGTVTFYNGSTPIGTATLSEGLTTGIALLQTTFNSVGSQSITAHYSGNDFYAASTSGIVSVAVYNSNLASSSVTLQASTTTPQYQANVTLSATVSPSAATGSVTFYNGSTNIGSASVSGGVATFSTSFAAGGTATLHAVYSGDYNYLSSTSNSVSMNVSGPVATTTTLQVSANSLAAGASLTLTATLSPANAAGTVTFYDNAISIGTANVNAGVATLIYTFTAPGTPDLTAKFAANSSWQASSSNVIEIFVTGTLPDTIGLTVSPSSIIIGYSATLTATITPAASGGSVTFYDGAVALGSYYSPSSGIVALSQGFMSSGAHSVTASFSGTLNYLASTSNAATLNVSPPGSTTTTTTLVLSEYSGYDGDDVTLTAAVSPAAATGQVNFYDNGALLGSAVVSAGTAAWSQAFGSDGANEITAVYQGDITYSSSASSAQNLVLSEPPSSPVTCPGDPSCPTSCPSDPIDCNIECPGDPSCNLTCPSDPDLCAAECPGYAGCPPDTGDSSTDLRRRTSVDRPLKLWKPLFKLDVSKKKGC